MCFGHPYLVLLLAGFEPPYRIQRLVSRSAGFFRYFDCTVNRSATELSLRRSFADVIKARNLVLVLIVLVGFATGGVAGSYIS